MTLIISAFLMGLFGLAHCLTMCGSLSMALGFSIPKHRSFITSSTLISLGRIVGYAIIGGLVNLLAMSFVVMTDGGVFYLRLLSSLLMIGIGLHIMGVSNLVNKIEILGSHLDRFIQPIKQKMMPIDSNLKCIGYGVMWGFLPCGLVYTALSLAFTAPNPLIAAVTMFAFGLGTLPALVGLTAFNAKLAIYLRKTVIRFLLGGMIISMAIWQALQSKVLIFSA